MKKGESKKITCKCDDECWTVHLMGGKPHHLKLTCIKCGTIIKFRMGMKE